MGSPKRRRRHSLLRRGIYALISIAIVVLVGTLGVHYFEGLSYLDSFYFTSMIATAQGPSTAPVTAGGKIFVALLAFVSVGTVVTALVFVFGPFIGRLAREGIEKVEEEAEKELRRAEGKGTEPEG